MLEIQAAIASLRKTRSPIERLRVPSEGGVYAIYLCQPKLLAPLTEADDGLIYIGLSKNLAGRDAKQHFAEGMSGSSTLRRSLGAILKEHFGWRAMPRAHASSERDMRNYRFLPKSETALSVWMRTNLEIGIYSTVRYTDIEHQLIGLMKPLLNLTKWQNPHRPEIRRLRKICADEARVYRQGIADSSRTKRAPD